MNKRTVLASLNKIANQLDNEGLHNEADTVTKVMSRLAYDDDAEPVQKSNLQRHIERFDRRVERILKEYPYEDQVEKRYWEMRKEIAYTLDDMSRVDRPAFEEYAEGVLGQIRDNFRGKIRDNFRGIEASTVTKNMSRLASDMSDFQKDPSGFVGDILDPKRNQGDLYGNYMTRHNNNVIDSLNEAIQDMKDDPMISKADIKRVEQIKNNLERIYNSDDDMGPEKEPFDYSSPEDEGDMYGEADGSDYGDDF